MGCADNIPTTYFPFNILQSITSINSSMLPLEAIAMSLIKTDIYLIAFDRLVYMDTHLIVVTLPTYSRDPAPEVKMITKYSY